MFLRDAILKCAELPEEDEMFVIYAKRVNGYFSPTSEALVLELDEEERELKNDEVAKQRCPGFEYALEGFLVKEMIADHHHTFGEDTTRNLIDTVIHYMEYDA
jgi:hypothetical protein